MTTDHPPAWGRLIEEARERLDPPVSQNEAARHLQMSGTNWRRIVSGAAGAMHSRRGAKTVARMARLVGLTPRELEDHGHRPAALEMERLGGTGSGLARRLTDDEIRRSGLHPETIEAILRMRRRIDRLVAERNETAIRRLDRVTEASLDDEADAV